jgi:hypothetical protein
MKRFFLSTSVLVATVGPALAGDGGGMDSTGAFLVQAMGRLAAKLIGLF